MKRKNKVILGTTPREEAKRKVISMLEFVGENRFYFLRSEFPFNGRNFCSFIEDVSDLAKKDDEEAYYLLVAGMKNMWQTLEKREVSAWNEYESEHDL